VPFPTLPATKAVPSPPVLDQPPQSVPANEDLHLNIDVPIMIRKMNMVVPMVEMCKIPSVRKEVLKTLKIQDEAGDPPVILNTMYYGNRREDNPPFYLSLDINGFRLNNCMLNSGASANVMPLKVMRQIGLRTTRPYGNVCGIDSKKVKVYGLIEDVKVYLQVFPHIEINMNVVVIDVPNAGACSYQEVGAPPLVVFSAWTSLMHITLWGIGHLRFCIVNML
jgi:hypothetical protein